MSEKPILLNGDMVPNIEDIEDTEDDEVMAAVAEIDQDPGLARLRELAKSEGVR